MSKQWYLWGNKMAGSIDDASYVKAEASGGYGVYIPVQIFKDLAGGGTAEVSLEAIQEALSEVGVSINENGVSAQGENQGAAAHSVWGRFLFAFDKALNQGKDITSGDIEPQYKFEVGRMEADGYSYLKPAPATSNQGNLPDLDTELRIHDSGFLELINEEGEWPVITRQDGVATLTNDAGYVTSESIYHIVKLTQAEYDGISEKDEEVLYVIVE